MDTGTDRGHHRVLPHALGAFARACDRLMRDRVLRQDERRVGGNRDAGNRNDVWVEKLMFGHSVMGIGRSAFLIDENNVIVKAFE